MQRALRQAEAKRQAELSAIQAAELKAKQERDQRVRADETVPADDGVVEYHGFDADQRSVLVDDGKAADLVPGHRVELEPSITLRPRYGLRMTIR